MTVRRDFHVEPMLPRASYVLAAVQVAGAALLVAFDDAIGAGPIVPAVFAAGGVLTGAVGLWTARNPIVTLAADHLVVRPAMLVEPVTIGYDELASFAKVPPGWLVFVLRDGREHRLPLTALTPADGRALVEALRERSTEVSYVEPS